MKIKFLIIKIFMYIIGIFIFSNISYALTGTQIIDNAEKYKNHEWTCNSRNARPLNRDGDFRTKDPLYPFIAKGEPIDEDPDGPEPAPTATGEYTGVAYAWGLRRDTAEIKKHWRRINEENNNCNNCSFPYRINVCYGE